MLNVKGAELTGRRLISNKFILVDRTIPITLPGEMEGWLAQNNLARFVVEVVEQLDTTAIEEAYRGGGSAPYGPAQSRWCEVTSIILFLLRFSRSGTKSFQLDSLLFCLSSHFFRM